MLKSIELKLVVLKKKKKKKVTVPYVLRKALMLATIKFTFRCIFRNLMNFWKIFNTGVKYAPPVEVNSRPKKGVKYTLWSSKG